MHLLYVFKILLQSNIWGARAIILVFKFKLEKCLNIFKLVFFFFFLDKSIRYVIKLTGLNETSYIMSAERPKNRKFAILTNNDSIF